MFSSKSFNFIPDILIFDPFLDNFCKRYEIGVQIHSYAYECPAVSAHLLKKIIISSLSCLGILVENENENESLLKNLHV